MVAGRTLGKYADCGAANTSCGKTFVSPYEHDIDRNEPEMPDDPTAEPPHSSGPARILTPAAQRALAEAEARRLASVTTIPVKEVAGRRGPEPVRYGDWEVKGIASDF